jgi:NADPH-dependent curcumin reductase CurA
MAKTCRAYRFNHRPVEGAEQFDDGLVSLVDWTLPELENRRVVVQNLYLSVDPMSRAWMDGVETGLSPVGPGDIMRGYVVGRVVESPSDDLAVDDLVFSDYHWSDFAAAPPPRFHKLPADCDPRRALELIGHNGNNAHFGLLDYCEPQEGETLVVTEADGATGLLVGQLGRALGCHVVGVVDSSDSCSELTGKWGFNAAVQVPEQTEELGEALREVCPRGIDILFMPGPDRRVFHITPLLNAWCRGVLGFPSQPSMTGEFRSELFQTVLRYGSYKPLMGGLYDRQIGRSIEPILSYRDDSHLTHHAEVIKGFENLPLALAKQWENRQAKYLVEV